MGNTRIQFRRGRAAYWIDENPILRDGEPGYETDTGKFKIGDGETHWVDLDYANAASVLPDVDDGTTLGALVAHIQDTTPHSVYDDGPSLALIYANAKV